MKRIKLREIAELTPGYSFRAGVAALPEGSTRLIQIKDLVDFNADNLAKIEFDNPDYLVRQGDILLACRGNFYIMVLKDDIRAVVPSSIIMIRPTGKSILPEYLAFYLGSTPGQNQLKAIATGVTIQGFNKAQLGEIEIPLSSLKRQQEIVATAKTAFDYAELANKKAALAETYAEDVVDKLVQGGR
jgi:restriction endonuclease S subunit